MNDCCYASQVSLYEMGVSYVKCRRLLFGTGVSYNKAVARKVPSEVREFFDTTQPEAVRAYFVKMGRKGGKIGGKKRVANQTAEERSESARKAVQARWAKARAKKGTAPPKP